MCVGEGVGGRTNRRAGAAVSIPVYPRLVLRAVRGDLQMLSREGGRTDGCLRLCLTFSFAVYLSCMSDGKMKR